MSSRRYFRENPEHLAMDSRDWWFRRGKLESRHSLYRRPSAWYSDILAALVSPLIPRTKILRKMGPLYVSQTSPGSPDARAGEENAMSPEDEAFFDTYDPDDPDQVLPDSVMFYDRAWPNLRNQDYKIISPSTGFSVIFRIHHRWEGRVHTSVAGRGMNQETWSGVMLCRSKSFT